LWKRDCTFPRLQVLYIVITQQVVVIGHDIYFFKREKRFLEYLYYVKLAAVLVAGLLLGYWFDQERKKMLANGKSWYKAWATAPGITIIVIIFILIAFRIYLRYFANS